MKRHHLRTAQNIFTLSLMSGLTLLAACGGGGKGGAAPAAPAAVVTVPVPTLAQETDLNEPYIAAPSSYFNQLNATTGTFIAKFQLNILDGGSQSVLKTIDHGSESLTGQWVTIHKFDRSTPTAAIDLGAQTLYFINKVGTDHQVFQMDLSRSNKNLDYKRISAVTNACRILDTYPVNKDGSQTALIIDTPGTDGLCGSTANGASAEDIKAAADNVKVIIQTDDSISTPGRSLIDPTAKVVSRLYSAGVLTGVLVQHETNANHTQAQLDILSPTMDARLVSGIAIPGASTPTFLIDPAKQEVGAEWVADAPKEANGGYLHIQDLTTQSTIKNPITGITINVTGFNRLYHLNWDNTTAKASLDAIDYALQVGVKSNKGFTDDDFVYIPDGSYLAYGPDPKAPAPFSIYSVYPSTALSTSVPLTIDHVTANSILLTQNTSTQNLIMSIDKATKNWSLISNLPNTVIYGVRGDYLYYGVPTDGAPTYSLIKYNLKPSTTGYNIATPIQSKIVMVAPVWDKTLNHDKPELSTVVMCAPSGGYSGSCQRETLKTFDFDKEAFDVELGPLNITDSGNVTVSPVGGLATTNDLLTVDKVMTGGFKFAEDVWLYHPKVPHSLSLISTIDPSTLGTPPTN